MNILKKNIKKNDLLVLYKLLHDLLLLILVSFGFALVAESLLPGLISSKISFSKILFALVASISTIVFLGQKLEIEYPLKRLNKMKIMPLLVLFAFLIIGNSLLLFTFWQNIIITLVTLFLFYLFYKLIFSSEN